MKLKNVLAGVAAGAVAIGSLTFTALADNGSDVSFKAGLVFQTDTYSFRNSVYQSEAYHWDEDDTELENPLTFDTWNVKDAEITGDGTYTVSFEKDVLDGESRWNILGLQTNISVSAYPELTITVDSLKIDGVEIEAAKSAQQTQWGLDYDEYCDIEGESIDDIHYVHFMHIWGGIEPIFEPDRLGGKVEVTFTVSGFETDGEEDEPPVIPATGYMAGLVFQTDTFSFRNSVYQSKAYHWDEDDTELENPLTFDTWNVKDAEITGDGTYTVSFEKDVLDGESRWNILGLQTNISVSAYPELSITVDSLKIDGVEIEAAKSAQQTQWGLDYDEYCDIEGESIDDIHYVHFMHIWGGIEPVFEPDRLGGKVELTFTVSGFDADNNDDEEEEEEEETETDAPETTPEETTAPETTTTPEETTTPEVTTAESEAAPVEELIDVDEDTGVQLMAAEGVLEEGVELSVVVGNADIGSDAHIYVLNITLVNEDGETVQPNGSVTVKIPLPEDFEESDTYYVYYQADDGTLTDMHATFENGYVSFVTDHFSTYILSAEKLVDDAEDDTTTAPATTTTTPAPDSGTGATDGGSANDDKNVPTGVIFAFIPALAAAAGVIVSKKRK